MPVRCLSSGARVSETVAMTETREDARISSLTILGAIVGALAAGVLAATVVAVAPQDGQWSDAAQWTLYMLAAGWIAALLGFVFAVPRVRTGFSPADTERYESNSNLEQISDWLTKLLVGAGLVQLGAAPEGLRALGDYLGSGLSVPSPSAYAASAVVYGVGVGFTGGYVWTRLRFRSLLERGDKEAAEASRLVEQVTDRLAQGRAADGEAAEARSDLRPAAERLVEVTQKASGLPAILWVDDNPRNNAGIVRALADRGIRVDAVRSTREALERVSTTSYALIISDVGRTEDGTNHPKAGVELLQALRERNVTTPVVVFTGGRGMEHAKELEEAGARLVTRRTSVLVDEVVNAVTRA